ncbi:uncharacterized protein LOC143367224 [Andrena cerasifolii]|uniref:uncharacterized protein LOC143367224 n=1 Tax=Andrena cerasifolii TaxID=2819439 RepID=UPI00403771F6
MFAAQEYYRMFWVYARNNGDTSAAAREFALEYPQIRTPSEDTYRRLVPRLFLTGSMMPRGSEVGRPAAARNLGTIESIIDAVEADPTVSMRDLSRRLNVSSTTVHRILRDRMLHPYKYVQVQHLHAGDYIQRVQYSRWLLGEMLRNPSFTKYILRADEALFDREGCFNSHNIHVWSDENLLALRPRAAQVRWSINLWTSIWATLSLGQHVLPDLMDDIPCEIRQNMNYQHDGTGPHYALNNKVYRQPVDTPEETVALIHAAVANITPQTLQNVQRQLILRAEACINNGGGHVEQFLN